MGLTVSYGIIKDHEGEIKVESELGKGSTFRVFLPWMRADIAQSAARISNKLDDLTKPHRGDFVAGEPATK